MYVSRALYPGQGRPGGCRARDASEITLHFEIIRGLNNSEETRARAENYV